MTIETEPRWRKALTRKRAEALDRVREVDLVLGLELRDLVVVGEHLREGTLGVLRVEPLGVRDGLEVAVERG